jgi:hypothetical protein
LGYGKAVESVVAVGVGINLIRVKIIKTNKNLPMEEIMSEKRAVSLFEYVSLVENNKPWKQIKEDLVHDAFALAKVIPDMDDIERRRKLRIQCHKLSILCCLPKNVIEDMNDNTRHVCAIAFAMLDSEFNYADVEDVVVLSLKKIKDLGGTTVNAIDVISSVIKDKIFVFTRYSKMILLLEEVITQIVTDSNDFFERLDAEIQTACSDVATIMEDLQTALKLV